LKSLAGAAEKPLVDVDVVVAAAVRLPDGAYTDDGTS